MYIYILYTYIYFLCERVRWSGHSPPLMGTLFAFGVGPPLSERKKMI